MDNKRSFVGMVQPGEPLIQQGVDVMQQYHEAEPNQPTEEAKREKGTAQIAQEGDGFVFEASAEQ